MLKRWAAWPSGIRWLVGIAAVVLAAAIVWALFVPVPTWLARYDVGSATPALVQTARDAARGRLLTLGAGLLAAGALFFTARNFILSREGQVTDRYTKAVEQLGSDKLDVRIGGIYALERVARDSAKDHPTVMEVLTAFIREHSREPLSPPDREHSREPLPPPDTSSPDQQRWIRPDVQAAVVVVGRRDARRDFLDFIDLTRAGLGGANLNGLNFNRVYLTSGDLTGATLYSAGLLGAVLTGANLTGATFTNANLTGAGLGGTNLTRTREGLDAARGRGVRLGRPPAMLRAMPGLRRCTGCHAIWRGPNSFR
jgi:hypothetical protein